MRLEAGTGEPMPAWVDAVEYGKFGRATVTATLFGGIDSSLYADFKKGSQGVMNAAENTLKHAGGAYGPAHLASRGPILDVTKATGEIPWEAAESKSASRRTSSSKASAPAESSASARGTGPNSPSLGTNI